MNNNRTSAMKSLIVAYAVCLPVLAVLDAVWLGLLAADFYQANIGHLMAASPRLGAALAFYLIYPLGVVIFCIRPALQGGTASTAPVLGAALGFFAYATYDLTNLATLRDWPVLVSAVDVAWGMLVTALVAWAGQRAGRAAGGDRQ